VRQEVKSALLLELLRGEAVANALVFTRTKHRANRLAQFLHRNGVACERVHGNRSQAQRTEALAGFKSGRFRVLVATDIAARGIDVEGLSHVVNFDVPHVPEDYIHRVGRTARAGATGEALTFVSPEELNELRAIERTVAKVLPRRTLEGFDYQAQPAERLEIPVAERLQAMRAARKPGGPARGRAGHSAPRHQDSRRRGSEAGQPPARAASTGRPARRLW
jgi:ATP-dependent RNA helicase RhlE